MRSRIDRVQCVSALAALAILLGGPAAFACAGDCNGNLEVTVDELVRGVNIATGANPLSVCPIFDANNDAEVTVDELVKAVNHALNGCPIAIFTPTVTLSPTLASTPTETLSPTITDTPTVTGTPTLTPLPSDTPTPTSTPTGLPEGFLGRRRFSLDPTTSGFQLTGLIIPLASTGLDGYVDLEAGVPDAVTGIAPISVVGSSEFLSVKVAVPIVGSLTVCVRPKSELFPIENVGNIDCDGGSDMSFQVTVDHNINDVDATCATGVRDVNPAHANICNSDFQFLQTGENSGVGAMLIAPDPDTLMGGVPVELAIEMDLPCGDESVMSMFEIPLALTTGLARARILNIRNSPTAPPHILEGRGEAFSCSSWTQENGPGMLVFAAPVIDIDTGTALGFQDATILITADD